VEEVRGEDIMWNGEDYRVEITKKGRGWDRGRRGGGRRNEGRNRGR